VEKLLFEDRDANVVANALVTVVEIFGESDERLQNAALLTALTNKIRDFGELSQHLVLKLTHNYAVLANDDDDGKEAKKKKSGRKVPPLPDDVKYQWMNSLESRISSPKSSLALAASRIFLELTKKDPAACTNALNRLC
jgi:vesicle coat complex subunit